ncbi:fatty acid desaturase family protein [Nocardia gamkensis]|uniref:Acyl-CoA desaturase n=1 Tax=Nocardia gamkensis TaxID=352869 RepID=A0A7X6R6V4_9NOCA|nr:acyl-CoA desaturase [Nocardia gamkensis]NKY30787.1 acyl-CoA desaturase [Nocardia gamkensis]NQE71533.1 Stearoyl-CoA 9-desaturase [Nocardia gamkensis]
MTILTETDNGPLVLSPDQIEELGRELDELRAAIVADLGERDREYLYSIIKAQRGFEIAGRGLMYLGFLPPVWLAAVAALSVSKILDNMEIGHNVMHGQYDWMREPGLNSRVFEWDTVCPADQWKHSHNYLHHTYTNIHNKDRDIGYSILRMDEAQEWNALRLGQPLYAFVLMMLFEWGVMGHDLEVENILAGKKKWPEVKKLLLGQWRKAGKQVLKDYLVFPALTGPLFFHTLAGNVTANLVRNVWAFAIIFCGHFPTGVQTFTEEETADETRGEWYIRQMLGSANISGSKLFHLMSGNLSHQIEHHLFPDLPASRYPEMAPIVRALCEKYGLPYNTGPLGKQIGSVWKKIFKLALPPRWVESEPSPGVIVMRQRQASEAGV